MIERNKFFASENKVELAGRLVSDDKLAKCLLSTEPDFLNYTPTDEERESLLWNQVFPCIHTVDTQQTVSSFITMKFSYERSTKPEIWKAYQVIFYMFCHESLVRTDYGVLRYDYMLNRINHLMNDSHNNTWYNRLEFYDADDIIIDNDGNYLGIAAAYVAREKWIG